jgi:flagellar motility protein MotE (MotC chaperone)
MNEDKINKAAGGNKKKAQAIKDKLEKQIGEWTSRRNAADDKIDDLNEQLTKVGEEIYDNFVGWKFELDKIWKITQKIKEASAFIETSS